MGRKELWSIRKRVQRAVPITEDTECESCKRKKGKKRGFLHRHHIIPIVECTSDMAVDPDNILVVCWKCHVAIHLEMGTWGHEEELVAAD